MPVVLHPNGEMQLNAEVSRLRREVDDLKDLVAQLLEQMHQGIAEPDRTGNDFDRQN